MKRYTVYFKDKKGWAAIESGTIQEEPIKITDGKIEWLVVDANSQREAIELANKQAKDFSQLV